MLTTAVIVWKFIGSAIFHLIGALTVVIVGFSFLVYLNKRVRTSRITYHETDRDLFKRAVLKDAYYEELSSEMVVVNVLWSAATLAVTIVLLATAAYKLRLQRLVLELDLDGRRDHRHLPPLDLRFRV